MTNDTFKVTIHMVSSLDGMIAKKDNSVSWFETPDFYACPSKDRILKFMPVTWTSWWINA